MTKPSKPKQNQALLSRLALASFRLNGEMMRLGSLMSDPVGLTSSEWQTLGAVLTEPMTISDIAREMGVTRQNVQRTAKQLYAKKFLRYNENPVHKTAKLLEPTARGRQAISKLEAPHRALANQLVRNVGAKKLEAIVGELEYIRKTLEAMES